MFQWYKVTLEPTAGETIYRAIDQALSQQGESLEIWLNFNDILLRVDGREHAAILDEYFSRSGAKHRHGA